MFCGLCQNNGRESDSVWSCVQPRPATHIVAEALDKLRSLSGVDDVAKVFIYLYLEHM